MGLGEKGAGGDEKCVGACAQLAYFSSHFVRIVIAYEMREKDGNVLDSDEIDRKEMWPYF